MYMARFFSCIFFVLAVTVLYTDCRKKAFDEYYGRPGNLAQPIYQQLKAKGNFTNLMACIDKAGYKDILSGAGYWTMFAANDSAFKAFYAQRGIAGIEQIDSGTAKQIVTYALVYNAFAKARLADFQSNAGWVPNTAFRRRTAYYTGYYTDTNTTSNKTVQALASNRNSAYLFGDNNNKSIPYFLTGFVTNKGLSAADYNYFYPNTTFTGFNVMDAAVVNADIVAENGYIHEINKVLLPLPSIDQYLSLHKDQYGDFKALFDKFMVLFLTNPDATNRYKVLTGAGDSIFIKTFNNTLAFSPNNENFLKFQDNDAQADAWTMFAPTNSVYDAYRDSVLLGSGYTKLDQMPLQIISDFLNAHMWQTAVWPSKFATTNNFEAEPARFNQNTDIVDRKILSNGIFYGTNRVQQANVFSTLYRRAYLDPKYLLMTRALDMNYRYNITVPTLKYAMIMMSDQLLISKGYNYSIANSVWTYTPPGSVTAATSNAARDNLQRILGTHIIPTPDGELDNMLEGGSGIIETFNGEYIKYNNGYVYSAGLLNNGLRDSLKLSSKSSSINGPVFYGNNLLTFDTTSIGYAIYNLGKDTKSDFNYFYQLLSNSSLFILPPAAPAQQSKVTEITGIIPGVSYTVFIPTNAAIQAAANSGLLPKAANGLPNFNFTTLSTADKTLVTNFINYHILNKATVVPDGKKTGSFETLFKNANGDPTTIRINSSPNNMTVTDNNSRMSNVVISKSNNLASRCVIHLIDNYLQY